MNNRPDAIEQLPDETDTAYHRFTIYLELGADRSLDKTRQKLGKSSGYTRQLQTWSSKYSWVQRSSEYDKHLILKSLKNKDDILDHAYGRLMQNVDNSLNELFDIINGPNYHSTEGGVSLIPQKLKAIELNLKLAGIVPPKDPVDDQPVTITNYIQNVYKKIERLMAEEDQ